MPIFSKKDYTYEEFAFNRLNPAIREYLLSYLENTESTSRSTGKAITLLGYVGNAEDLEFIEEFISRKGTVYLMPELGKFAGILIRRNIDGAERFYREMVNYIKAATPKNSVPQYEHCLFLVYACSFSLEDYTVRALKMAADDDYGSDKRFVFSQIAGKEANAYSLTMRPCSISSTALQERMAVDYLKHKEDIDAFIARIDQRTKRVRAN